ncbi:hypothetical protein CSUI_005569 [Cystoisospora suis]|uniref:Uncharacterized protein n=1 Tax=Cystoisospora suis TaxID=483139 RepID=A0A2C6KX41_9APIC|nr:hypothetical protein CSUI_005569 [Cystoisospora suis]
MTPLTSSPPRRSFDIPRVHTSLLSPSAKEAASDTEDSAGHVALGRNDIASLGRISSTRSSTSHDKDEGKTRRRRRKEEEERFRNKKEEKEEEQRRQDKKDKGDQDNARGLVQKASGERPPLGSDDEEKKKKTFLSHLHLPLERLSSPDQGRGNGEERERKRDAAGGKEKKEETLKKRTTEKDTQKKSFSEERLEEGGPPSLAREEEKRRSEEGRDPSSPSLLFRNLQRGRREVDLTTKRGRRDVAETHLRNAEKSEKRELTEVLKEAERRAAEEEEQEVIEVQEERRQKKGRGPVNETDEERKSEKREVSKKKKSVERPSWIYIRLTKFLIRPSVLFGVQAALDAQLSSVYTHVLKKLSEEIVRRKQLRRERELREAEKEKMKVRRDEANLSGANVYRDGSTSQGPRPFSSLQKDSLSASRSERCERERGEENEREEDERKMKKKKRTSLIVKRKGRSLSGAEASLGRNANTVTPLFLRKQRPQDRRYLSSSSSSFDVEEEEEEHSQEERRKKEDEEGGEANRLSLPFPPICQKRPTTYLHYCFGRCKAGRVSPNPRLLISLLLRSDIFSPSLSSSSSSLFRSMPRRSFSSTHHLLSSSQRLLTLFSDEDLELASHYLKSRKRSLSSSSCSSSLHADAWNLRLTASLHYSCFYVMEAPEINEKEKERRGGRRRKANRKSPPRSQPTSLPSRSSDRRRAGRDEEEEGTTTSVTGGSSEEESEEEKKYGGGVSSVRRPSSYQRAPLKSFYSGPLPLKRMTWYDLSPGPFLSPFSPSSSPPPPDRFSHRKEREEDISGSFTFRIHSRRNAEEKREEEEGKAKGEEEDYDNSRYQQHPAYGTSSSSFAPSSFHLGGVEEVVVGHPLGEDCGLRGVDTQRQGRRFLKSTPGRMREGHRGPGEEERERRENIYSSSSSSLPSSLHVRFQKRSHHAPSFISSSFSSAFHPYSTTSCTGDFSDLSPTRGREGDRRDRRGLGPSSSFAPSPSSYSSFSTSAPSRSFAAAGEEEEEKKMKRETLLLVDFQEVSVVVSDMRKKVEDICKKVRLMSEKMMVSSKGRRKGGRDTSHLEKGLSSSSFSLYNSREKTDMMNLDREMVGKKRSSLKSPVAFEEDRHTSFLQGSRRGDKKKSEDLLLRRLSDDEEEEEDDEEKWRHVDEAIPVEWDFPPFLLHPLYTTDVDSPSSSALSPLHPLYRTGGQRRGAASSLFRLKKKLFLFVWIYASSFRSFREDEEELKNLTKELFRDTDEIFIELPSFLEENGGRTHAHPHSETGSENKRDVDDLLIGVFKIPLTRSSSSSPVSFHTTTSDHFLCSFFVPSTLPIFVDHSHCQFFYYPFEGEDEEEEEEEEDDLKRGGSLKRNASSFRAAGMAGLKNAREGRLLSSLSSSSRLQTFDGGFDDTFDSLRRRGISNYLPQSFSRGIRRRDEDEGIERLVERRINGVSFNECYLNQHRVWIRGSPLGVPSLKRKKWRIYQSKRFASSSLSFFFPLSDDEEEEQEEKKSSPPSSKRYRTHGGLAGGTVLAGKGRGPLSLGDFVVVDQKEEEEINRRRRKLRERKKDSLEIKEKERRRTKAGETIDEEREEENGVRLDCPQVSTVEWMKREGLWRRDDFLKEEEERSSETSFASCEDEDHEEEETEGKKGRGRRGVRSIRSILSSSSTSQIPSSCSSIPTSSLKGGESSFFLSNDTRRHRQPGTPSFSSPPPLPRCPTAGFSRCLLDKREKRREEQKERRERSSSRRRRRHKGGKRREEGRHLLSSSDPRKKGRRDGFFSSSSFFSSSPPTSPGASEEEERRRKDRSPVFLLSERKKDRPIPSGDRTRRDLIFPFSSSPPSRRGDVHLLLPSDRPSPRIFTPRSQLHRNGDEGGEQKKRALLSLLPSIQTHTPPPSVPPLRSPSERRKLLSSGSPLSSSRLLPQAIFPFPSRKKRFSDSERDLLHSQGSARSLQGATRRDDRESRLSVRSPRGEEEEEKRRGRERGETQLTVPKIVFKKEPEERTVASPVSRRSGPEEVEEERKKREKERTEQELRGENRCIDSHIPRSEEERRSKEEAEKEEEEKKKKENITTDLSFSSSSPPLVLLIEKYMKEKSGEEEKKEKRGEEEKKEKRGEEEKEEKSGEEGEKEKIGGGEKERSEERKVTDKDKKNYHKGIEEENTSTCVSSTSSSVKNRTSSSSCSLSQKEESEKTRRVLKKKRYLCGYDEDNEGEIGGEVARAAIALRMKELLRQQGEGEEDEDRDLGLLFGLSEKRKERRDSSADGEEEEVDLSIFDRKSFERDLRNLRESSTASQKAEGASMKVKEEEEERRRRREDEEKDRGEEEDEFLRKQGKDRETFSPSSSSALSSDMSRVLLLDRENRFLAPVYLQQKHSTWESQENLLKLLEEEEYERHLRIENAKKRLQDLSLQETLLSPSCRSKKRQERSLYLRHALEQKRKNNPRQDEGKDYLSSSGEDGDSLSSSFSKEEEEDPCSSSVVKSEEKRRKEVTEEMIREERRRDEERIRKDLSQQEQRIKRPSSSDIKSRKDPLHSSRRVSPQELRPSSPPLSKRPSLDSSTHALHGGKEKKSNLSSRDHSSSSLHPSCGRLSKLPSRDASVEEEEKKKKKDLPQSQDFSSSSSPLPPAIHLAEQHSSEDALLEMKNKKTDLLSSSSSSLFPSTHVSLSLSKGASLGDKKEKNKKKDHALQSKRVPSASSSSVPLSTDLSEYLLPSKDDLLYHERKKDPSSSACPIGLSTPPSRHSSNDALHGDEKKKDFLHFVSPTSSSFSSSSPPALPSSRLLSPSLSKDSLAQDEKEKNKKKDHLFPSKRDPSSPSFSSSSLFRRPRRKESPPSASRGSSVRRDRRDNKEKEKTSRSSSLLREEKEEKRSLLSLSSSPSSLSLRKTLTSPRDTAEKIKGKPVEKESSCLNGEGEVKKEKKENSSPRIHRKETIHRRPSSSLQEEKRSLLSLSSSPSSLSLRKTLASPRDTSEKINRKTLSSPRALQASASLSRLHSPKLSAKQTKLVSPGDLLDVPSPSKEHANRPSIGRKEKEDDGR